jgi:hypothetical protein
LDFVSCRKRSPFLALLLQFSQGRCQISSGGCFASAELLQGFSLDFTAIMAVFEQFNFIFHAL